jgi:PAS domain S-box-containing protein
MITIQSSDISTLEKFSVDMLSHVMDELNHDFDSLNGPEESLQVVKRMKDLCFYYNTIIENCIDGVFITDGQGCVIKVNQAYEQLSGYAREEILNLPMKEFETRKMISQSVTLVALNKKAPVTMNQILFRTGKKVLVSCNPLFDENNEIIMVVSSIRDITELESLRNRIMEEREKVVRYQSALEALQEQLTRSSTLVARDEKVVKLMHQAQKLARVDTTVLITGETGVGKDEFARFIHDNSPRNKGHFIKVNCGAIPDMLMESELFGYEKGAFSGANPGGKSGLFEVADKGTIFLDEISEQPLNMQVKLLQVIQDKKFTKVGGTIPTCVDVKIVAATNKDLKVLVAQYKFREDLFYRLNVVPLLIPPLRQRHADIAPLVQKFTDQFNEHYHLKVKFSTSAIYKLISYSWPGNVRELKNLIERTIIFSASQIITAEDIHFDHSEENKSSGLSKGFDMNSAMSGYEKQFILRAYEQGGSVSAGAGLLNMKRSTFAAKLKKINDALKKPRPQHLTCSLL